MKSYFVLADEMFYSKDILQISTKHHMNNMQVYMSAVINSVSDRITMHAHARFVASNSLLNSRDFLEI